jgi:ketosteroid isomerase-like protein
MAVNAISHTKSITVAKARFFNAVMPSWTLCDRKNIDEHRNTRLDEYMKPKTLLIVLTLSLSAAAVSLAGDSKAEQALRDADDAWSKTATSKDLDKTVAYYSNDAIVLPPNAPIATTKDAIKKLWGDLLASSGLIISWKATKVEVAKSGDFGFVSGTYEFTMNDASGKPTTDKGKYVEVWEKKADGKWKCGTDIWNSDLPTAPAFENK